MRTFPTTRNSDDSTIPTHNSVARYVDFNEDIFCKIDFVTKFSEKLKKGSNCMLQSLKVKTIFQINTWGTPTQLVLNNMLCGPFAKYQ